MKNIIMKPTKDKIFIVQSEEIKRLVVFTDCRAAAKYANSLATVYECEVFLHPVVAGNNIELSQKSLKFDWDGHEQAVYIYRVSNFSIARGGNKKINWERTNSFIEVLPEIFFSQKEILEDNDD